MNKKNNKIFIILMGIIIVILAVLCILFATNKISFKEINNIGHKITEDENTLEQSEENNKSNQSDTVTNNSNFNSVGIDYDKFVEKMGNYALDYGFIKMDYIRYNSTSYNVGLTIDGKVIINFEKELNNISDISDIQTFSDSDGATLDDNSSLYILDNKGNLYKYTAKDYSEGLLQATKMEEYTNVSKIFAYYGRKINAGGCDSLVIESNNNYIKLKSFCV